MARGRRSAPQNEDLDDDVNQTTEFSGYGPNSEGEDDAGSNQNSEQREQLARNLVRYALSCEYSRQPIRRADVAAKVLGTSSKQFRAVFAEAQIMLRHTFGMEMVDQPKQDKVTVQQKRAAQKSDKPVNTPTNTWYLTSILPTKYRTADIITPSRAPTVEQESVYVGLYTFVVAVIYLSGGTLAEAKLDRYLRRMNASENTPIDRTEKVLQRMVKDGYIVRVKDNSTGEEVVDYIVGPRGKVEIGQDGVSHLAQMVFDPTEAEQQDLSERLNRTFAHQVREEQPPPQPKPRGRKRRSEKEAEDDEDEEDD